MINEKLTGKDLERSGRVYFKVLTQLSAGGTEENHKNTSVSIVGLQAEV
jgi:hypothetical protein